MYRFYVIGRGNHVNSYYDNKDKLRPIFPCQRDAFKALEDFVQKGVKPPASKFVPKPKSGDAVNNFCIETTR